MIYYNSNTINDWNLGDDNIIKVYRNGAVCYYKITGGGDTPTAQTPCFAVVDDISQYSDTEFEDAFETSSEKWYKLNNLDEYEEYGVYGSGRTITTYEGKLTIDGNYEYIYSGNSWINVGEISGYTALPDVPFSVNFNAKNYDAITKTLAKTSGQLVDVDAVITAGTPTVHDGYLTIASGTRATISGYSTYFNRTNSNGSRALTIVSKQKTDGSNCHMFANRDSNYNWMYRCYSNKLTLHGGSETGSIAVTTQPVIESVRVQDSSPMIVYNNYTNSTTSSTSSFSYGSTNSGKFALFAGYGTSSGEWFVGDFYWVYMTQNTLTDEQVQQVIEYNEGGDVVYPMYYDEIQDPPNNLVFSSMTEADSYECPWVGMHATIAGDSYIFSGDSQSGYEWVYNPTPPTFQGKWLATYTSGTSSAQCDSTSAITSEEITLTNLVEVLIGHCVTSIGTYAFGHCDSLTSIDIPNSVTSIGNFAFFVCIGLRSCTIGSGVTSIGTYAFYNCTSLTSITVEATTPPTLGSGAFDITNDCPIYVPAQSVNAYKSASGWSTYASRIQAIPNS